MAADDDWALVTFAIAAVAAGLLIGYLGREQWFRQDEWDTIVNRHLTDPSSLIRGWYGHVIVVPVIAYRLLFGVVGLHTYWPYQALTIGAHLVVATCLRVIMRRMQVNPWLATTAAGMFLVYSAGNMNLFWGFQVSLTGALACGLVQILLVDHEGPTDRRDRYGFAAGVLSTLFSGVGPVMVALAGGTAGIRRGWRAGLVQVAAVVPLLVLRQVAPPDFTPRIPRAGFGVALEYARGLIASAWGAYGVSAWITAGLFTCVALGVAGVVRGGLPKNLAHSRLLVPVVLGLGSVFLALLIGFTRGAPRPASVDAENAERYLYLIAALALPAVVGAIDRLLDDSRHFLWLACALFVAPIPLHLRQLGHPDFSALRPSVETWAMVADQVQVRGDYNPAPTFKLGPNAGQLGRLHAAGKIDDPPPGSEALESTARLTLAMEPAAPPASATCHSVSGRKIVRLDRGDWIWVGAGGANIGEWIGGQSRGELSLHPATSWRVLWGPLNIAAVRGPGLGQIQICR
ncbi:MAG: hypothetical protein ABIP03_13795 [Aquihabitans sp.]